jgi:very-short-patch-repair endonuclease
VATAEQLVQPRWPLCLVGGAWHDPGMRKSEYDVVALGLLLRGQCGVLSAGQASECQMTVSAIRHRIREGGPWRALLPGVYLTHNGLPNVDQRDMAAILYAGPRSMITGQAALWFHGIRTPPTEVVDVLVPETSRRRDTGFVRLHPTTRMPAEVFRRDAIRYAPIPRALADTGRLLGDLRQVRAIVADAVQHRRCTPQALVRELGEGPMRGSARLRQVLREIADGVRSAAEGELRDLIKRARLPDPMYNPRLFLGETFIASPDCWWGEAGVAVEVDSREWHLSPQDWERTTQRHAAMTALGIFILHFSPRRIRSAPKEVVSEIRATLAEGSRRSPLPIRAVPVS